MSGRKTGRSLGQTHMGGASQSWVKEQDTEIKHILSFPVVLISYYQLHILLSHAPLHNEGRDSAAPVHVCATNRAELT